jgi:mutator protein MutT
MISEVAAALIWDKDKFLICQRPAHKARALLWEFAGGKVEPGESKEQALFRECKEELAVTLSVGDVFMDVVHEYPDVTVRLTLFNATIDEGTPQKLEHNDIRWITPAEIPNYKFCPADEELLKKITEAYSSQDI